MSGTPKRASRKSDNQAHRAHIDAVKAWILEGRCRTEIVEYVRNEFLLERAQADSLMASARKEIREASAGTIEESAETLMACFWDVYRKAKDDAGTYYGLQALKEMARLKGLDTVNIFIKEDRLPKDIPCETLVDLIDNDESNYPTTENN